MLRTARANFSTPAARIERELGLASLPGGRHEGLGTHNRIVPLGGGYLELLGVADQQEAEASDFGRGLLDHLERDGDGLLGWVVAVDDAGAVARRLGTTVTTIWRSGLSARLTGLAEAMREPFCRSSSAATLASPTREPMATRGASPGSSCRATRHDWNDGSTTGSCRCASCQARPPCAQSASATGRSPVPDGQAGEGDRMASLSPRGGGRRGSGRHLGPVALAEPRDDSLAVTLAAG